MLALKYDRLPGKVCTEALALRLQSSVAQCYIATGAQSTVGSGAGCNVDRTNDTTSQPAVQGFVLIETSRGSADVVLLAVRSDCKRQGVGRALLSAALANAAAAGCSSSSLSVLSANAPAVRLYRSLGFDAIRAPTSTKELGDDDEASGEQSAAAGSERNHHAVVPATTAFA